MGKSQKKKTFRIYSDGLKFAGCLILIGIMTLNIALFCQIINAELVATGTQTLLEMILVVLCAVIAALMLFPIEFIVRFIIKKVKKLKK